MSCSTTIPFDMHTAGSGFRGRDGSPLLIFNPFRMAKGAAVQKLSQLKPKGRLRVMDLVADAGVDVRDWANVKGGKTKASVNPKYCYEWSYIQPNEVVVLNLWYESMMEKKGAIEQRHNFRQSARLYEGIPNKSVWKSRAEKMDLAVRTAAKEKLPIRVIVCDGQMRDRNDPNAAASKVKSRMLDPVPWSVSEYNNATGQCTLRRGTSATRFIDQFSLPKESPPQRHTVSGEVFARDPEVRRRALLRANGKCQWCGEQGFSMSDGGIYLETHHIVPLAEGGSDATRNVAALCPNHHREAHHGASRLEMREALLARIRSSRKAKNHV
jgi:hypothetical protein